MTNETNQPTDVATLQLEVLKKIQAEITALRDGLERLTSEVANVRTEVTNVRTEVTSVRTELRAEMNEGFTRVRTEITELRGDVDIGFTAMRMQNDRRFLDHERRLRDLESDR
ncbi:MAG: hypothetical protein JNM17_25520 [Archangium sp.]|nr:hypothetical protein [Archangium sp.]